MDINSPLSIVGLGALSALGTSVSSHYQAVAARSIPFRRLGELLGKESPHAARPGAWIENRSLLTHRKWSPVTMAALLAAREAIEDAGWTQDELRDSALVVGTSRGNAAGWLAPWPGRRPFRLMAASNTIHSEPASAISIEFQITGPQHVVASGCAAGLDAIGLAMMLVRCGAAPRALAVAVDLPLVPLLLDSYASSGVLASELRMNPYHPKTTGFIPSEGAAAMAISARSAGDGSAQLLTYYASNSDAHDPVGMPKDGGLTPNLFKNLSPFPIALCSHATGTAVQSAADSAAIDRIFFDRPKPTLHLLKPFLGHTIGASGMIESVILASFLRNGYFPANAPELYAPEGIVLPEEPILATGSIAKISHGMGGHNAVLVLSHL